jgi:hypothetical protein
VSRFDASVPDSVIEHILGPRHRDGQIELIEPVLTLAGRKVCPRPRAPKKRGDDSVIPSFLLRREWIHVAVYWLGSAHPRFRSDASDPIGETWDKTEVFPHMLFPDQPYWYNPTGAESDRCTEEPLQHEDTFCVMPQRTMSKISSYGL